MGQAWSGADLGDGFSRSLALLGVGALKWGDFTNDLDFAVSNVAGVEWVCTTMHHASNGVSQAADRSFSSPNDWECYLGKLLVMQGTSFR